MLFKFFDEVWVCLSNKLLALILWQIHHLFGTRECSLATYLVESDLSGTLIYVVGFLGSCLRILQRTHTRRAFLLGALHGPALEEGRNRLGELLLGGDVDGHYVIAPNIPLPAIIPI
jgi:hypothetical protein